MPSQTPVAEVMTRDVVAFTLDQSVRKPRASMVDAGVDAGPVLDDEGQVVACCPRPT